MFSVPVLLYWYFGKIVSKTSKPVCVCEGSLSVSVFVCEYQQVGGPVITVWPTKQDLLYTSST